MKELICIVCPRGCHLKVDEANDYAVTGNSCPRGAEYGRNECTHPTRVLTTTVKIDGAAYRRCPVRTERAIDKSLLFKAMDALITNFHLPESTLVMLVSAFAGREHVLNAYKTAVEEKYRFFSFGDAMFLY